MEASYKTHRLHIKVGKDAEDEDGDFLIDFRKIQRGVAVFFVEDVHQSR